MTRQRRSDRTNRTPFGVMKQTLNVDKETQERFASEGLVARWINDVDDRIIQAYNGDYDFVDSERTPVKTGDAEVTQEQDRRIRKRVGKNPDTGESIYAYLMAIPREFYEEDQQLKEEENRKVDQAIKGGRPSGLTHHGVDPEKGYTNVKNIDYKP